MGWPLAFRPHWQHDVCCKWLPCVNFLSNLQGDLEGNQVLTDVLNAMSWDPLTRTAEKVLVLNVEETPCASDGMYICVVDAATQKCPSHFVRQHVLGLLMVGSKLM